MKVGEEETVKLARTDWRVSAVTDSSRNVWYHCRLWTGSICPNSRKSCVCTLFPPIREN